MRIPRIYTPEILSVGATLALDAQSSRHFLSVLRAKPGAELLLFNGRGGEYRATLLDHREISENAQYLIQSLGNKTGNKIDKGSGKKPDKTSIKKSSKQLKTAKAIKIATVMVTEFVDVNRESPLSIELGIGISRGERMDWLLQKSTELGVQKITPLFTERTEVKLDSERREKKYAHWRRIIMSACEQSGRTRLPELAEPVALLDWHPEAKLRFVLDPQAKEQLGHYKERCNMGNSPTELALLVGPEGGLSDDEVAQSIEEGFVGVRLGPRILRTETAPLAAITQCQTLWGDL